MTMLRAEACCLWQCARFSLRHRRYFVIFLSIWIPSLVAWRARRVVRFAFVALQWIDDIADGHRRTRREPLEILDELLEQMTSRRFADRDALSQLLAVLFDELPFDAQDEFIALVRQMRRDRERVIGRERWSEAMLDEHHRRTFTLSIDLLLRVTGCRTRANAVMPLVDALAWCSVFRDLEDDLRHGLINVPAGVDRAAWSRAQYDKALVSLAESRRLLGELDDKSARELLTVFQKSVERFARSRATLLA